MSKPAATFTPINIAILTVSDSRTLAEDSSGQAWLKTYVTAVSEEGKANQALIDLISKEWKLPKKNLEIISGYTTRQKIVRVLFVPFDVLQNKVECHFVKTLFPL